MAAKKRMSDAELVVVLDKAADNLKAAGDKTGARSLREAANILRKKEVERAARRPKKKR